MWWGYFHIRFCSILLPSFELREAKTATICVWGYWETAKKSQFLPQMILPFATCHGRICANISNANWIQLDCSTASVCHSIAMGEGRQQIIFVIRTGMAGQFILFLHIVQFHFIDEQGGTFARTVPNARWTYNLYDYWYFSIRFTWIFIFNPFLI